MNQLDEVGLGQVLQKARQNAGLTQQDLCHAAKLSYSTLAKIERGAIKSPSVFTIKRIAEALNVSLDELLGHKAGADEKQVSRSGVRFVYFDVNGCLVRFYHRAFSLIAEDTGMPSDQIESTFWHYNDAVCRGEQSLAEFNKHLAVATGQKSLDWADYYLRAVEPIHGMEELLDWANQNYDIGLLTNIMPGLLDRLQKENLIPSLDYKAVVDSSEVGAIKPEPKIYEIAQGLAGVKPEEILLVDDSRANLIAAEKLGWKVLWFNDYQPEEAIARIRDALNF